VCANSNDSLTPMGSSIEIFDAGSLRHADSHSLGMLDEGSLTFDAAWRRTGGWLIPATVLERMAPHAASGGAIGPDGRLHLLGHDRPEMYVVARPPMGPTLVHVATIDLEAEGQAFSWARDGSRTVFTIDRRKGLVRTIELPAVAPADPAVSLTFR